MKIVPAPLQTGGEFRNVDTESSRRDRVQGFRGKHGDTHVLPPVGVSWPPVVLMSSGKHGFCQVYHLAAKQQSFSVKLNGLAVSELAKI
jgi:hypothetical protein